MDPQCATANAHRIISPEPGGRMQHILPALFPLVETARVDYTPATTGDEPDHEILESHNSPTETHGIGPCSCR